MTMIEGNMSLKLEKEGYFPEEPTPRVSVVSDSSTTLEKPQPGDAPCYYHGASQTPHLDAQFRQPGATALIGQLNTAAAQAANGERCWKCAAKDAAHAFTVYVRDLKAAKKGGKWTKEEKKALKAEAKSVIREIKYDCKKAWKETPSKAA